MKKFGHDMMERPCGGQPHPGCERGEGIGHPGVGPERMGPGGRPPFPGGAPEGFRPGGPSGEPGFPPREGFGGPGCGPHGPGGPGGPHGCGPRRAPRPRGRVTESPRYQADDVNGKLVTMLRVLGHAGHHMDGSGGQGRVLSLLKEEGEMTQRELTGKLGIQPGSASEIIGKLEKGGFLIRTPSLTDRRTADVSLTAEGTARAEEHLDRTQARREAMFAALTDEEKASLLQLLEKLYADWEEKRSPNGGE